MCVCVWWRDTQRWRPAHRQAHASGPNTDAGDKVDVGCVVVVVAVVYRCLSFAVPSFCVLFLFILCVCVLLVIFLLSMLLFFCSFVSSIRFAAAGCAACAANCAAAAIVVLSLCFRCLCVFCCVRFGRFSLLRLASPSSSAWPKRSPLSLPPPPSRKHTPIQAQSDDAVVAELLLLFCAFCLFSLLLFSLAFCVSHLVCAFAAFALLLLVPLPASLSPPLPSPRLCLHLSACATLLSNLSASLRSNNNNNNNSEQSSSSSSSSSSLLLCRWRRLASSSSSSLPRRRHRFLYFPQSHCLFIFNSHILQTLLSVIRR